jgi:hypothetical protein
MQSVILAFLYQEQQLYLPGLGLWSLVRQGARYNEATQSLQPPGFAVSWQPPHVADVQPLQPLLGFISRQTGEPEETCYEMLQHWLKKLEEQLRENGEVNLQGLGKLISLNKDSLTFVPQNSPLTLLHELPAPRLAPAAPTNKPPVFDQSKDASTTPRATQWTNADRQVADTPESPLKKDRWWWIPPLIAGAIAIGFILAKLLGYL